MSKTLTGPYIEGAWYNKPSQTIFLCVSCGNNRELSKKHAIMYDEMADVDYMECYDCGDTVRNY